MIQRFNETEIENLRAFHRSKACNTEANLEKAAALLARCSDEALTQVARARIPHLSLASLYLAWHRGFDVQL